ncbi:MAG: Rrf2 family transcriptional regulator [Candidatus Omnitrophica bacterium]|nr:Rrf2 family transcriptional regulator [Candidatus Omnitrophota bacterium]
MNLLNKNTDYAVRAIVYLAGRKESVVSSREISERQDIPLHFVRRILQDLVREGYLVSREGAGGGVRLVKKPGDISVSELIELYQGDIQISECMFRKRVCPNRSTCPLRKRLKKIEKKLADEFRNITVRDLLEDTENTHEKKDNTNKREKV